MTKTLTSHKELKEKILALEDSAKNLEAGLLTEVRNTLKVVSQPGPLIKDLTHELARDKDFRKDLLKIGLSAGANYLGKMISSPATGEAILSFLLKKPDKQNGSGEGGVLSYIARLLEKLKPNKNEPV
ncbi:MAG TPA: hypothetical protein PL029_12560 [Bacteroidia bacterium]|nr:hypothetical protein [Bacteroidia bacterium]